MSDQEQIMQGLRTEQFEFQLEGLWGTTDELPQEVNASRDQGVLQKDSSDSVRIGAGGGRRVSREGQEATDLPAPVRNVSPGLNRGVDAGSFATTWHKLTFI